MPRLDLEHAEQRALIRWAQLNSIRFPVLQLLYSVPNGGKRPPKTAKKMVDEGLKAGVWDLHLPVCGKKLDGSPATGLWIEMKAGSNKLTEKQKEWKELLEKNCDHEFAVCYSWVEGAVALCKYLGISTVIDGVTAV